MNPSAPALAPVSRPVAEPRATGGVDARLGEAWASVRAMVDELGASPAVAAVLQGDRAAPAVRSALGSGDWIALVSACQRLVNAVGAMQACAMAQAAAYETGWQEDGTLAETPRLIGVRPLDAGALVSEELATSDRHASRRVDDAVEQMTRLPRVVAAMSDGRLDVFRAGVVTEELAGVPEEVAGAVCALIDEFFATETAGQIRRRIRSALRKVDPSLVKARARRARSERGARRALAGEGMDA